MKKILCLALGLAAIQIMPVFAQPAPPGLGHPVVAAPPDFQTRLQRITLAGSGAQQPALTKFNLDFPGGTSRQLVAAIEKAMGKPLNVIISADEISEKTILPPVKVNDMDVVKLFNALRENSKKYGGRNGTEITHQSVFYTLDQEPSDSSLWTFSTLEVQPTLTLFNLDFPGGTPAQLVAAIEKAIDKPLNVIIPTEDADVDLPPIKMNHVDVDRLFSALEVASSHQVRSPSDKFGNYSIYNANYGFRTDGIVNDNSVWHFHADKPVQPVAIATQKVCQFYSLADYLQAGLTVDDITTVIQNGWKMAGINPTPELQYHKETKLLMAYGEPEKLATIDNVLKVLKPKEDLATQLSRQLLQPSDDSSAPKKPADASSVSAEKPVK